MILHANDIFCNRYGMWRVMPGLHESVEFSMMEAGHTKFNPDWHLGYGKSNGGT